MLGSLPEFFRRLWLPLAVFLVTATLTWILWSMMAGAEKQRRQLETEVTAEQVKLRLEAWFDTRGAVVAQFAEEWGNALGHGETDFPARAQRIIDLYPGFQALNFIDQDWVIRVVVPAATNQAALGKDLHFHPSDGVREAIAFALENRLVHRSPLIFLLQGEPGFATYMPVFDSDDHLQGFINGVFGVDELVDTCLNEPNLRERFNFRLITSDGGVAYNHSDGPFNGDQASVLSLPVRIVDRPWQLELKLSGQGLERLNTRADQMLAAIGFGLSLLLALLLWAYQTRQRELNAERQKYRLIVENQADFLVKMDLTGVMVFCGPSFCRLLGRREEDLLGRRFEDQIAEEDGPGFETAFAELLKPSHRVEVEFRVATPRAEVWTAWTGAPFQGPDDRTEGYIWVGRDVSQRRELESQLRRSQRLQAVGQLAGGIAHDFNNILQAIQGYIEFVREDLPDDSVSREDLDQAHQAAERAAVLVRQLLAFSRRQILKPANLDLNQVITGMMSMMERVIGPSVTIVFQGQEGLGMVRADQGQVEQILMNLAVNARDAMESQGNITIATSSIELDADFCQRNMGLNPGSYARLEFSDTGPGMAPEIQEKLFEPFFTTKESGTGTGLGLATVYGIVKQHEGMINVDSSPGQGATFTIYLPVSDGPCEMVPDTSSAEALPGQERVLLAEDEPLLRRLGQRILESAGYTVLAGQDGEDAWAIYQENASRIDVLVLDVVMPGLNGFDLAGRIRKVRPGIPVVFVSGYDSDEASGRRQPLPGSLRLPKPYNANDLLSALRRVLEGHESGIHEEGFSGE